MSGRGSGVGSSVCCCCRSLRPAAAETSVSMHRFSSIDTPSNNVHLRRMPDLGGVVEGELLHAARAGLHPRRNDVCPPRFALLLQQKIASHR